MKILSKPFGALAIHLRTNDFFQARLKLTALYILITAIILGLFSGFLYYEVEDQLAEYATGNELLEDGEEDAIDNEPFVDEFVSDFEDNLVIANILILVLVGLLGYWLAGRTLRPIQEKMLQHEQFSSDVAHEIRTPLSALLARTESVLRKQEEREEYLSALTDIQSETKRLITLTEDLLLTANQGETTMKRVGLKAVISSVVERLRPLAEQKGLDLVLYLDPKVTVKGNQALLERLFQNLLHNAIKFTNTPGTITLNASGKTVSVTDTGIGMSEETKSRVFDRFYTKDASRDERTVRGVGLGLAIVEQIAVVHNATVSIDSTEGKGTVVTVHFLQ